MVNSICDDALDKAWCRSKRHPHRPVVRQVVPEATGSPGLYAHPGRRRHRIIIRLGQDAEARVGNGVRSRRADCPHELEPPVPQQCHAHGDRAAGGLGHRVEVPPVIDVRMHANGHRRSGCHRLTGNVSALPSDVRKRRKAILSESALRRYTLSREVT